MFRINYQSIFIASSPVDFRMSFNGLCGVITARLGADPLNGSLFVFYNKRRDCIKMIFWEGDGFWLLYKRLEAGTFEFPCAVTDTTATAVSYEQLQWILSGVELDSITLRKRYRKAS